MEKKNLNYELQSMYGNAYDELLREVRRKQHDYKNQLSAIESMLDSLDSEEKIKCMHEDYLNIIDSENEINSLLSKCYNPIIAGYLYTMYIKCKDKGVNLMIDVNVDIEEIDIKTKDIIEVLGVFITNAYEHVLQYDEEKRVIKLKLYYINKRVKIEVRNIAMPFTYETISKLFKEGYSTKGDNRGIGLCSVKKIAEKYFSGVCVENIIYKNQNWILFSIEM